MARAHGNERDLAYTGAEKETRQVIKCETSCPMTSRWLKFFTGTINRVTYAVFAWNHITCEWKGHCTVSSALFPDLQVQQNVSDHNMNHKLSNVSEECENSLWKSFKPAQRAFTFILLWVRDVNCCFFLIQVHFPSSASFQYLRAKML